MGAALSRSREKESEGYNARRIILSEATGTVNTRASVLTTDERDEWDFKPRHIRFTPALPALAPGASVRWRAAPVQVSLSSAVDHLLRNTLQGRGACLAYGSRLSDLAWKVESG